MVVLVYSAEQLDGMSYSYMLDHSHTACEIVTVLHEIPEKDGVDAESSSTGSAVESVKLP